MNDIPQDHIDIALNLLDGKGILNDMREALYKTTGKIPSGSNVVYSHIFLCLKEAKRQGLLVRK